MAQDIDFEPFAEGDAVTATALTSRFSELSSGINALSSYALADKSLGAEHLPGLLGPGIFMNFGGTAEFDTTKTLTDSGAGEALYPASDILLSVNLSQITLGEGSADNVTAILVLANVHFRCTYSPSTPAGDIPAELDATQGFIAIDYAATNGGASVRLSRSERFIDNFREVVGSTGGLSTDTWQDMSIRVLITADDTATIDRVELVGGYVSGSGAIVDTETVFRSGNLTVIGLYGKEPA
jgi:hypothetical protein